MIELASVQRVWLEASLMPCLNAESPSPLKQGCANLTINNGINCLKCVNK